MWTYLKTSAYLVVESLPVLWKSMGDWQAASQCADSFTVQDGDSENAHLQKTVDDVTVAASIFQTVDVHAQTHLNATMGNSHPSAGKLGTENHRRSDYFVD